MGMLVRCRYFSLGFAPIADGDVSDAQVYEEYRQKVPAAESTALEPVTGRCAQI
jgi:hypothetical protein